MQLREVIVADKMSEPFRSDKVTHTINAAQEKVCSWLTDFGEQENYGQMTIYPSQFTSLSISISSNALVDLKWQGL